MTLSAFRERFYHLVGVVSIPVPKYDNVGDEHDCETRDVLVQDEDEDEDEDECP
jgi:hypothetical protein